jgi:hypothetical protein
MIEDFGSCSKSGRNYRPTYYGELKVIMWDKHKLTEK